MNEKRRNIINEMKSLMKGILYIFIIFIIVYSTLFLFKYKKFSDSMGEFIDLFRIKTEESINARDLLYGRLKNDVYKDIHEMSNTLVEAVDGKVWGLQVITEHKIDSLIKEIYNSDYDDKNNLLDILNRWKNKDFSEGVSDHNYVWKKLGGTVGKAIDLKEEFKNYDNKNKTP